MNEKKFNFQEAKQILSLIDSKKNFSKQEIEQIQSYLKSVGYNLGNTGKNKDGIDGYWGNKTTTAVNQLKSDFNTRYSKDNSKDNSSQLTKTYNHTAESFVPMESIGAYNIGQIMGNAITKNNSQKTNPYKEMSAEELIATNPKLMQQLLLENGYDLGKWRDDGIWGNASKKAWKQAQTDGYILKDGQLVKSKQKSNNINDSNDSNNSVYVPNPSFFGNLVNFIGNANPFHERAYKGTEEEARQLGYKYYTPNGFTRHPVDYSIEGSENMNAQQLAQAQLDKYGITSEQVRDKSPMQNLVYQYSPGYGYNIFRLGENIIRGNKVRDKGQRNTEIIETPVADKISNKIANVFDSIGFNDTANDLRASTTYDINESAQRNDISNLYFGYPMNGNTLKISPYTETGRGNKPEHGYFFEFTNANHIYNDPAYENAVSGGASVQAEGENMGNWSASINNNGKKVYYDKWDINPFTKIRGLQWLPNMNFMGTSYELYGKQK